MELRKVYDELYGMIEDLKKKLNSFSATVDYETQVTNLPKVNNITLKGNKKSSDLKIAYSMTESEYAAATKNTESIYCLQENAGTITDSAYVNLEVADWTDVSGVYKQTKPFVFEVTPAAGWTIEDVSIETGIATVDSYEVTEDPFGLSITYAAETLPEYGITATVTVTITQPAGNTRIVKNGVEFGVPRIDYSTTERKIGKWVDGSDLYEKTFYLASATTEDPVVGSISGLNVGTVTDIFGSFENPANQVCGLPFAYYDSLAYTVSALVIRSSNTVELRCGSSNRNLSNIYVTIRYTKTS